MIKIFDALTMAWQRGDRGRKYKKPKRGDVETEARSVSAQDRAGRDVQYGKAGGDLDTAQGTLSQFEGPVEKSPFYKALKTAGTESTADSYRSAKSNVLARAKASGFGGAGQPVTEGATAGMESEEAKAQAQVPGRALTAAAPLSLEAARGTQAGAGIRAGMGGEPGREGEGYFTQGAVPLEQQYQDMMAKRRAGFWKALQKAGGVASEIALAGPTGGASLAAIPGTIQN